MTLDELMNEAAQMCIDEREAYLVIFTEGLNGYVCRNEGVTSESRALFRGTYRDCQIWVERRGIVTALLYVLEHRTEVPELAGVSQDGAELLTLLAKLPPATRNG
jgi:hypothetical protein